ncbi:MAG: hypothetical protein IT317_08870 [Anaerolineales bacterium]|nr:hypothetical protein [Anaerolineales bacterium]
MELVERYVQAVKEYLPDAQQNDIARELAENLRAQMEDRAEALGRPLTTAEQEVILKRMGNPAVVAGKYQANPMRLAFGPELIGPGLFPIYGRVLLISFPLLVLGNYLAALIMGTSFGDALAGLALKALTQFAIITGIFMAAQAHLTRYPDQWDPRDPSTPIAARANPRLVSRTQSLLEIIIILVFVGILRAFPAQAPAVVTALGLGTVWGYGYWLFFGLTLASLVPPVIALVCPSWIVFRAAARVVIDAAWIGTLLILLALGIPPGANPVAQAINTWLPWGLGAVAVGSLVELGYDLWRLNQAWRLSKAS